MLRVIALADVKDMKTYLSNLYEELYVKDIIERNKLEREDILNAILDFTASQIGSLTNPTNIANVLTSMRHDVKGKTYFNYPNKYYYTDLGLRNARLNYRQYDPGHIMENIIYNELVKRGYSVDVGVVKERKKDERIQREIDFIVNDRDCRIYIQSAYQMEPGQKEDAELLSLKLTGDFFKKIVIRMDIPHNYYDDNGFFHCNLIDFLLHDVELF